MARGLNQHQIIGNIGSDPELKYLDSGAAVVNFSVATDESYKDRDGNLVERTVWHRIVAWNRLAEIIAEYASKGTKVFVQGPVMEDVYEKDGVEQRRRYIKAGEFTLLSSKGETDGGGNSGGQKNGYTQPDDDLPF